MVLPLFFTSIGQFYIGEKIMNIMNVVENTLTEMDLNFDNSRKSDGILCLRMSSSNTSIKVVFHCQEEQQRLSVYTLLPNNIPEDKRSVVSEFIVRCNYSLNMGHFDMDFSDGEVRYKWGIDVEEGVLSSQMVKIMFLTGVKSIDNLQPHLMKLCYGNMSTEEVYKEWKND